MKTIEVYVSTNKVGSTSMTEIEVADDASDEEIEETAREAMFNLIDWGWRPIDERSKRRR